MLPVLKKDMEITMDVLKSESLQFGYYRDPNNTVGAFIDFVDGYCLKSLDQPRSFVGLVQVTQSGKTRLLVETAMKRPLVLIHFRKTNSVFYTKFLSTIAEQSIHSGLTYHAILYNNKITLMKTRLFILSYLEFTRVFKIELCKNIDWDKINRDIKYYFMQLLNGGDHSGIVAAIFEYYLNELNLNLNYKDTLNFLNHEPDQSKIVPIFESLRQINTTIKDRLKEALKDLNFPFIALDEFHVLLSHWKGALFHGDYKSQVH